MKTFAFLLILSLSIFADEQFETKSHEEIRNYIVYKTLQENISPKDVLVVYDIDNTLLKMKRNFGSDQWFNWQSDCLKMSWSCPHSLAKSFDELINIQYEIFSLASMTRTEPGLSHIVSNLQNKSFNLIALTSRGPEARNATERELQKNGFKLSNTAIGYSIGESFIPAGEERTASYQNGIFMTSGMNKGKMLRTLVDFFGKKYKAIFFIDDHKKHTDRVYQAYINQLRHGIYTFRYGRQDEIVSDFNQSSKSESISLGRKFMEFRRLLK